MAGYDPRADQHIYASSLLEPNIASLSTELDTTFYNCMVPNAFTAASAEVERTGHNPLAQFGNFYNPTSIPENERLVVDAIGLDLSSEYGLLTITGPESRFTDIDDGDVTMAGSPSADVYQQARRSRSVSTDVFLT
jgi:hypothetical protein